MSRKTEWTDDAIARLRALWDEGHSTAEIGRRLGVTKNAVIGKSHRLELLGRESPIRRDTVRTERPAAPRRLQRTQPVVTLPPLASLQRAAAPAPAPALPPPPAPPPRRYGKPGQPCCWPLGEPGRPGFRFCEDASEQGRPYCAEHSSLAFMPRSERHPATA